MKNIYVGNLSYDATEPEISALFEEFGSVQRVNVVMDRDTGRPRGFAFVEMSDDSEGDAAIKALDGTELGGRNLTVNEARPRASRSGGGGGGDRGGDRGGNRRGGW